jgi:hypothetical protein
VKGENVVLDRHFVEEDGEDTLNDGQSRLQRDLSNRKNN